MTINYISLRETMIKDGKGGTNTLTGLQFEAKVNIIELFKSNQIIS